MSCSVQICPIGKQIPTYTRNVKVYQLNNSDLLNLKIVSKFISDGNWGPWSSLSACNVTCGGGTQSKTRLCNNPAPSNGGAICLGSNLESNLCNVQNCPIGISKFILKTLPFKVHNFWNKIVISTSTFIFKILMYPLKKIDFKCITDGNWGAWSSLSACNVSCGGGTQSKTRLCNNPAASNGGTVCPGSNLESLSCNIQNCPIGKTILN